MSLADARIREMQLLAKLDRDGEIKHPGRFEYIEDQQMVVSLIHDGYVNDGFDELKSLDPARATQLLARREFVLSENIHTILNKKPIDLKISHKGRVRLAELRQQLQTGRGRDPTGLCLAKRHLHTDLAIAILSVSEKTPLSLAYFDMNGLKAINDRHSHASGDAAIKAYLEAIVSTFAERGEAYRGEGGDEAVIILPNSDDVATGKLIHNFVRELARNPLVIENIHYTLTASCGSVSTTNPSEDAKALEDLADRAQKRAKIKSKEFDPRPSTIAIGSADPEIFDPRPNLASG